MKTIEGQHVLVISQRNMVLLDALASMFLSQYRFVYFLKQKTIFSSVPKQDT